MIQFHASLVIMGLENEILEQRHPDHDIGFPGGVGAVYGGRPQNKFSWVTGNGHPVPFQGVILQSHHVKGGPILERAEVEKKKLMSIFYE